MFNSATQHISLIVIALFSNFLSALAGGGAGLVQLPSLILLGLPFTKALATHKLASVTLGIGASIRHYKERNLSSKVSLIILIFGIPGVIIGANMVLFIPENITTLGLAILIICLGIF